MPKSKGRQDDGKCVVCNNALTHAQVVIATIETEHLHKENGRWNRSRLRLPETRRRVPLVVFCGNCSCAQPSIPIAILKALDAPRHKPVKK